MSVTLTRVEPSIMRAERQGHRASQQLFALSILYLFLLFAMLLVDRMPAALLGHFA